MVGRHSAAAKPAALAALFMLAATAAECFVLLPGGAGARERARPARYARAAAVGGSESGPGPPQLFIFGVGYTGLAVARAARQRWGQACRIAGTCRTQYKADALQQVGIEAFPFDLDGEYQPLSGRALETLQQSTHVLSTMPPIADFNRDPVFEFHRADLSGECRALQWAGYLSTTSVYGDHQGAWVSEESETRVATADPSHFRLAAEAAWLGLSPRVGVSVFRLAGIYGPGRSALDTVRKQAVVRRGAASSARAGQAGRGVGAVGGGKYISRVHVDDIAQTVLAAMERAVPPGRIYNVADDEPCPRDEVHQFARQLLGLPPADEPAATASGEFLPGSRELGGGGRGSVRTRRTDNKRVSNRRMVAELGVTLKYPTYRQGLRSLHRLETAAD